MIETGLQPELQEDGNLNKQCNLCTCVALHTDGHNGSRQTVVGTITVNTDGRRGKEIGL